MTTLSLKNPYQKLVKLKVIVDGDQDAKDAQQDFGDELEELRPRKRADCLSGGINAQRPCPWYGCKYHLGLDINDETGSMSVRPLDAMVHTCDLDVAEIGGVPGSGQGAGISLEEAGEIMDLTRERMRQIEVRGLIKVKPVAVDRGLAPDDHDRPIPLAVIRRQKIATDDDQTKRIKEMVLALEPDES